MRLVVQVHPEAAEELDAAIAWYDQGGQNRGVAFEAAVDDVIERCLEWGRGQQRRSPFLSPRRSSATPGCRDRATGRLLRRGRCPQGRGDCSRATNAAVLGELGLTCSLGPDKHLEIAWGPLARGNEGRRCVVDHSTDDAWDLIATSWHLDEHIPAFPIPAMATQVVRPDLPSGPVPAR